MAKYHYRWITIFALLLLAIVGTQLASGTYARGDSRASARLLGVPNTEKVSASGRLLPPPNLTGQVTDAISGSPLKATIEVVGTGMYTQSDPLAGGNYSFTLSPGTYTVRATTSGCYIVQSGTVVITSGGTVAHKDFIMPRSGPDAEGYSCYDNAGRSYVPASDLALGPNFDEDFQNFEIPMNFTFYGVVTNTGTVNSNGFVTLGSNIDIASFNNYCIPDPREPNGFVAVLWDDLENTSASDSGVYTDIVGTAPNRTFIVEWRNFRHFTDATQPYTNTVEMQIDEATSDIYLVYPQLNGRGDGREATIGIENDAADTGTEYECNTSSSPLTNYLWSGDSIRFFAGTPPTVTSTASPTNTGTATRTITPGGPTLTPTATETATHEPSSAVVISEFRTRGLSGNLDEFIELYNLSGSDVNIGGWKINASSSCGEDITTLVTIPANTILPSHKHFLAANSLGYSDVIVPDRTYTADVPDAGGIAVLDNTGLIVDAVGMCADTAYFEDTPLDPFLDESNRSYERKPGGALGSDDDTNVNREDFDTRVFADPQNLSSPPAPPEPTATNTVTATPTCAPNCAATATPTATCPPSTQSNSIANFAFFPRNMTINVGTTILWTNFDNVRHTTTNTDNPVAWDSGYLAQNQSFSYTFNVPGTYHYYCSIHAFMTGTIVVQPGCASTPPLTFTPTVTSTPRIANLIGHVIWQGRTSGTSANQVPVTLTLKQGTLEVNYLSRNTDVSGFFTTSVAGLPNGTYNYRIKGVKYLASSGQVTLTGAQNLNVEMGLQKAGDANSDNIINASDFSILKVSTGKQCGDPGFDGRADFNGDCTVNISDFGLLRNNFGQAGPGPILPGDGAKGRTRR